MGIRRASSFPLWALVPVLILTLPHASLAQGTGVSAVVSWPRHHLMGQVAGSAVSFAWPPFARERSTWFGAERLGGVSRRTGTTCVGFAPPGPCPQQPLRDDTRITTVAIGLTNRAYSARQLSVDIVIGVRGGRIESNTHGLTTNETIRAAKAMWGIDFGVGAELAPLRRLPIALSAGVGGSALTPIRGVKQEDGYSPFSSITLARARAGIVWRAAPRS
jgi:hypothetical protein